MVLHKRLNYGFNGYEVPPIPRAARSTRRRGRLRSKAEDNQMCAFDLLATVAGKILLEGQSAKAASVIEIHEEKNILDTVKEEQQDDGGKFFNVKPSNEGSFKIDQAVDELESELQNQPGKEIINLPGGCSSRPAYAVTASGWADEIGLNENKVLNDDNSESGVILRKLEGCSSGDIISSVRKAEDHGKEQIQSQSVNISKGCFGDGLDTCSSGDTKIFEQKPPALVNLDSSIKLHLHGEDHSYPFPTKVNVKVVSRDDDENSLQCTQRSTVMKTSRSPARIGDRRIRKLLSSRYWRVPPKVKDEDLSGTAGVMPSLYQHRKNGFKRQRSHRIYPLKKRKLFYSSPSTSDGATGCEGNYMSSEKTTDISESAFGAPGHGASGTLSAAGQSTSFQSREPHVKVRVKSFRVPELFIELSETATIGFLKRTVMEAITTIFGSGLHVGVVLRGRKIKDDTKSLVQTGISHDNKVDGLGFTLEPNHPQIYSSMGSEDMPYIEVSQPVSRLAPAANIAHQSTHASAADNAAKNLTNSIESDHDSAPSPAEISTEKGAIDLKALVIVPEANAEALAVVPPLQKSKQCEMTPRRIRCPFSVAEAEALVQAVEKLGTGRWRDVKLCAFQNVKHRNYVDLKDKWKTLVHTARISPQQRRGEPVPQELLDRVLAAHAYWSQQQAKQQSKACLL